MRSWKSDEASREGFSGPADGKLAGSEDWGTKSASEQSMMSSEARRNRVLRGKMTRPESRRGVQRVPRVRAAGVLKGDSLAARAVRLSIQDRGTQK